MKTCRKSLSGHLRTCLYLAFVSFDALCVKICLQIPLAKGNLLLQSAPLLPSAKPLALLDVEHFCGAVWAWQNTALQHIEFSLSLFLSLSLSLSLSQKDCVSRGLCGFTVLACFAYFLCVFLLIWLAVVKVQSKQTLNQQPLFVRMCHTRLQCPASCTPERQTGFIKRKAKAHWKEMCGSSLFSTAACKNASLLWRDLTFLVLVSDSNKKDQNIITSHEISLKKQKI